jgi:hypothetical protein
VKHALCNISIEVTGKYLLCVRQIPSLIKIVTPVTISVGNGYLQTVHAIIVRVCAVQSVPTK